MLQDLFYGNIIRAEYQCKDETYQSNVQKWLSMNNEFIITLTPEQRTAYDKIADLHSLCSELYTLSMYECGFRDGASVMLDVLAPNRTPATEEH